MHSKDKDSFDHCIFAFVFSIQSLIILVVNLRNGYLFQTRALNYRQPSSCVSEDLNTTLTLSAGLGVQERFGIKKLRVDAENEVHN